MTATVDTSYDTSNYQKQGGAEWDVGGSLEILSGGSININSGGTFSIAGVDLTASVAAIANDAARYVAAGATKTLTVAANNKQVIKLDTAAGSVVTLPAATGSGARFRFVVSVLATTNSHIVKVANSSDAMQGGIFSMDDTAANAVAFFAVAGTDDTITLNRTTTGSVTIGEWFEVEDFATNRWQVHGFISNTGSPATPFSNTV